MRRKTAHRDMNSTHHKPIWDRGEEIDSEMLAFTIGDDWAHDQRLVQHDIRASVAHVRGLHHAGHLEEDVARTIETGLLALESDWLAGNWQLTPADEDVHSAIERRLIEAIGVDGERMHFGRSRNDQVAVDMRLWLREAAEQCEQKLHALLKALRDLNERYGKLPLPGYTHLRRAMPSSVGDWVTAHHAALHRALFDLQDAAQRWSECPLGSGSGYGVPVALARDFVAHELGFDCAEQPVTAVQHSRGRAELAYLSVLEGVALDLGKLVADLWLYSSGEFNFLQLPATMTTGSSLMPQKRNPDLVELLRAQCRQIVADRAALLAVIQDLPSGYHRDFQLIKPPLFRAHDRAMSCLHMSARLVPGLEFNESTLEKAANDPQLQATQRALDAAQAGTSFRTAYREEASK